MKYGIRAIGVLAMVGFAFATQGDRSAVLKVEAAPSQELLTSTPGVTYVVRPDGNVEFHVPSDFEGVAITPDGRNLYLAN